MPLLLVVEDERKLLDGLRRGLCAKGFEVLTAMTGEEGYALATTNPVDAIVLDVMLPGCDGFTVLDNLRKNGFLMPVLMLTARDAIEDRVHGLEGGADDYLVKPFAFAELVARLRSLLRRNANHHEFYLRAADVELDLVARRVVRDGIEVELTGREFQLLEFLLRHQDADVTREMIAHDVWREPAGVLTNVIDVYINQLRKKIERPGLQQLIHTVRGVGYRLRSGKCGA